MTGGPGLAGLESGSAADNPPHPERCKGFIWAYLPRRLWWLANEARVALDGPRPSPGLVVSPAKRKPWSFSPAMPSPCHSKHDANRSATVNHGHSRSSDLGALY
jgi:hypothetical protein